MRVCHSACGVCVCVCVCVCACMRACARAFTRTSRYLVYMPKCMLNTCKNKNYFGVCAIHASIRVGCVCMDMLACVLCVAHAHQKITRVLLCR